MLVIHLKRFPNLNVAKQELKKTAEKLQELHDRGADVVLFGPEGNRIGLNSVGKTLQPWRDNNFTRYQTAEDMLFDRNGIHW